MITRKFLDKIKFYFDELNYRESKRLNLEKFENQAMWTLKHAESLSDAIYTIQFFRFCLRKWKKIEKIFDKKLDKFNQFSYVGNFLIHTVSDDDATGVYYLTNAINNKVKDVFIASQSFEEDAFSIDAKHGKFFIYENGKYYIKYAQFSSSKMKVYDSQNNHLCNIVFNKDNSFSLEKNNTPFVLGTDEDGFTYIYDRKYVESLKANEKPDETKCLAEMEWDILASGSTFGVAKLNVYQNPEYLELYLLFATSTFLLFRQYMQALKSSKAIRQQTILNTAYISSMNNRSTYPRL